ncbi:MAG: hypothetical protein AAF799_12030 [Myxococcota bacterium]
MTVQRPLLSLTAALCFTLATASGCGDDSSTGDDAANASTGSADTDATPTPAETPASTGDPGSTGDPSSTESTGDPAGESTGAACGPAQLCARTINECEIELTQPQCEGWYADPAQHMCADIEGYTSCNCGCIDEPTCDAYFECGMLCFEDFC